MQLLLSACISLLVLFKLILCIFKLSRLIIQSMRTNGGAHATTFVGDIPANCYTKDTLRFWPNSARFENHADGTPSALFFCRARLRWMQVLYYTKYDIYRRIGLLQWVTLVRMISAIFSMTLESLLTRVDNMHHPWAHSR